MHVTMVTICNKMASHVKVHTLPSLKEWLCVAFGLIICVTILTLFVCMETVSRVTVYMYMHVQLCVQAIIDIKNRN